MARVAIIQGHPDSAGGHLCHALADAYAAGAQADGHAITRIDVAALEFPWLRTKEAFDSGVLPAALVAGQEAIAQADHLLVVYPLWLGTMPALLKAFFEQVFRPGFAFTLGEKAHGLKSLERSILGFCGIGPIRESLFGMIDAASAAKRDKWLARMRALGGAAR
jgi:putative NADPH-quinone reductase